VGLGKLIPTGSQTGFRKKTPQIPHNVSVHPNLPVRFFRLRPQMTSPSFSPASRATGAEEADSSSGLRIPAYSRMRAACSGVRRPPEANVARE